MSLGLYDCIYDYFKLPFEQEEDVDEELEPIGLCAYCMDKIYADQDHYKIGDDIVHYDDYGDCLSDYIAETYGEKIDDDWWFEFDHNDKHYRIEEVKGTEKLLMDIFSDCLVEGEKI